MCRYTTLQRRQDAAPPCAVSLYTAHRLGILRGLPMSRSASSQNDCPIVLDSYRCTPLQQKLREGTCAVPGPRQCPHPPHRGYPGQSGRMACQPCPQQLAWLQRASRQTQGQGGRERKVALVSFEPTCRHVVRAMKRGGVPTQPTYNHQSITDRHQCGHV